VGYYLLHTKDAELCIEEIVINTILAELAQEKVEGLVCVVTDCIAGNAVTGI
jgi:hypothetical protein